MKIAGVAGSLWAIFAGCHVAMASTGAWEVGKLTGHAWIGSEQTEKMELSVGMTVPEGMTVFTSDRTRVLLVRGAETMMVGPQSVIAVTPYPAPGMDTTVLEQAGTVTFEVATQSRPHFSVETPMLAAVVKGTHFTVSVTQGEANVAVARGLVGVTSLATGQSANISPGQSASVSLGSHGGMSVSSTTGSAPSISVGPARAAVVGLQEATAGSASQAATGAQTAAEAAGSDPSPGSPNSAGHGISASSWPANGIGSSVAGAGRSNAASSSTASGGSNTGQTSPGSSNGGESGAGSGDGNGKGNQGNGIGNGGNLSGTIGSDSKGGQDNGKASPGEGGSSGKSASGSGGKG